MTSLAVLKRRSVRAREVWQLIRVATLTRSSRHAFNLAARLGWDEQGCHSTAALAKIYFEHGQGPFENAVYGMQGEYGRLLCLCECHRSGNPCGCCEFFDAECLCACHECQSCNGWGWDHEWGEPCNEPSTGFCDACSGRHDSSGEGSPHPYGAADDSSYGRRRDEDDEHNREDGGYRRDEEADEDEARRVGGPTSSALEHRAPATVSPAAPTPEERVRSIAERLTGESGFSKLFKLVPAIDGSRLQGAADSKENAVLVTDNLVRQLDDDQLAYILAHEIAHFEHDDSRRMSGYVEGFARDLTSSAEAMDARLKEKGRGFVVRALAQIGHGVAGVAAGYVMVHGKSREHEREADSRAIELMNAAGFDPDAASGALRKLHGGHAPDVGILQTIGSTHPNPASRVEDVARQAAATRKGVDRHQEARNPGPPAGRGEKRGDGG